MYLNKNYSRTKYSDNVPAKYDWNIRTSTPSLTPRTTYDYDVTSRSRSVSPIERITTFRRTPSYDSSSIFETSYSSSTSSRPSYKSGLTSSTPWKSDIMASRPLTSYNSSPLSYGSNKTLRGRNIIKQDLKPSLMSNGCMYCGKYFGELERLVNHESVCFVNPLNLYEYTPYSSSPVYVPTSRQINSSILDTYCNYCDRKFSRSALERHLPICGYLTRKKQYSTYKPWNKY